MPRLDTLNQYDLFLEISDLARQQGVQNVEAWNQLVEQTLQSHLALAELNADQDIQAIRTKLEEKWEEYKREAQVESSRAIDEDTKNPHV